MKPDDEPDWLKTELFHAAVCLVYVLGTAVGIYILWKLKYP